MNDIFGLFQTHAWAMEKTALQSLFTRLIKLQINMSDVSAFSAAGTKQSKLSYGVDENGRATIPIKGVLLKNASAWLSFFGIASTSYKEIESTITQAVNDKSVSEIMLNIESPGGEVAGVMEAADAIYSAGKKKPVNARIEDIGASGAYWLASQANSITANANAEVGSIGVYTVYYDMSKMAEDGGIKTVVIRSGEYKGMGVPGAPITENQIGNIQNIIDGMAGNFIGAIARGRKMEKQNARELATGEIWLANDAKSNGLIDEVEADGSASTTKQNNSVTRSKTMAEDTKPQETVDVNQVRTEAASAEKKRFSDLKGAFPNEPEFVMEQFEKGASVDQAKIAFGSILQTRLEAAKKEAADLKAENERLKPKADKKPAVQPNGAPPVASDGTESPGGEGEDFMSKARALAKEEKIPLHLAQSKVARREPELYTAHRANLGLPPITRVK